MKVQFIGTSASPSVPVPFCNCRVCSEAQKIRGNNFRKRSSFKVNDDMIIDIGPDIMSSSFEHNITLTTIDICLQTHYHEDHFDPEMIISRHKDYGSQISNDLLLVGSKKTLEMMNKMIINRCGYGSIYESNVQSELKIKLLPIAAFKSYKIGNYQITGYPANHGSLGDGCLIYSIEYNNKCLFYATDTSIIFGDVWESLIRTDKKFDLIVLDHTYGIGYESKQGDHLAMKDFINHVKLFKSNNLLKDSGIIYATHLSHEGILEHTEFDNYAKKYDYHIAYDGLMIDLD